MSKNEFDIFEPAPVIVEEPDAIQEAYEGAVAASRATYQHLKYQLESFSTHTGKVGTKAIEARYADNPAWIAAKKLMAAAQEMFAATTGKEVPPTYEEAKPVDAAEEKV